jgi:ABC-type multidrug transport system ATPase subunit
MSFKSTTPTTTDLEKQSNSEVSTLSWNNLTFSVPGKTEPIIQNVSGELVSGELLAVMGPSGAGKSTFLDALCQRVSNATGTVSHFRPSSKLLY